MTKPPIAIHWFRQDLRLSDNAALTAASHHDAVLPIYILDDENAGDHAMGAASRWWLHHSLHSLNDSLDGRLCVYSGDALTVLKRISERYNVTAIYWNRCYEPWRMTRDAIIKQHFKDHGISVHSYNASLLWEPWLVHKKDGSHYKVFTPFYRKGCLQLAPPHRPISAPKIEFFVDDSANALTILELNLEPQIPWHQQLAAHWTIGEAAAQHRLNRFLGNAISHYKEGRNIPSKPYVSRLSPHLHFGEISPNQLWYTVRSTADNAHVDHFCSELGWREFSYSQLYFNPELPRQNLQVKFNRFPWNNDAKNLRAWQRGLTGVPMVDAGMRELWQTGYMHGRTRMVVGSFLVKNLRLHWHHGERWFWDCLLDADLASNSASWQWIAGCGADAAPYFRIFNPVTQGGRFDADGDYIRQYIPELAALPNKYLFSPWEAPEAVLAEAGIKLGATYPKPIVDLKLSREQALEAFKSLNEVLS